MACTKENAFSKENPLPDYNSLREHEINQYLLNNYRGIALAVPEAMIGETLEEMNRTLIPYHELGWKFMRFKDERGAFILFQ